MDAEQVFGEAAFLSSIQKGTHSNEKKEDKEKASKTKQKIKPHKLKKKVQIEEKQVCASQREKREGRAE